MSEILKLENEGLAVEFEVIPAVSETDIKQSGYDIDAAIKDIDNCLNITNKKIEALNSEIDRLTNHADGMDYIVAVVSGILAGAIDSIWVGDFSLDRANEYGDNKVNNFVIKIAQKAGYTGDDLNGAVKYLEKNYAIVADKATNDFGGGLQHHLRDFSHHPTLIGLFFSMLTQFTHKLYGTDVAGHFKVVEVSQADLILIGKNLPEKITFGLINWFFHMISDMAGSSSSISKGNTGTGLPGPLVSFLKEISALPIFRKLDDNGYKKFSVWISKLFNGTLLAKKDENGKIIEAVKFDLRTEIGVANELKRQAVPVIINECIVRGFYFIRRLCNEIKSKDIRSFDEMSRVDWKATLPFKNRTIVRMLTISTGTDIGMGIKRNKLRNERMQLYTTSIRLLNAKVYYCEANMWIAAEDAGKSIEEAYQVMIVSVERYQESIQQISEDMKKLDKLIPEAEKNNPGLTDDIYDILKWG